MQCQCWKTFLAAGLIAGLVSFISIFTNPATGDIAMEYILNNGPIVALLAFLSGVTFSMACFIAHHYRLRNSLLGALAFFILLYLLSFRDFSYNLGYALLFKPVEEVALRLLSLAFSAPLATALIKNSLRDLKAAGGLLIGIVNLSVSCLSCTLLPMAGLLAPILSFTAALPYEGGELALVSAIIMLALTIYEGRKQKRKALDFHVK